MEARTHKCKRYCRIKGFVQLYVNDILGLQTIQKESANDLTNEVMNIVLQLRSKAKENKGLSSADLIRDELNKLNIQVKDGRRLPSWELN